RGPNGRSLSVTLGFGTTSDQLTGMVSNELWSAQLSASQAVYGSRTNRAPFAHRNTLVIPGSDNGGPQGNSYGAVEVQPSGLLTLRGALADGTALNVGGNVLAGGQWPLYVPLYRNKGLLLGWLSFDANQTPGLSGTLSWIKPATPSSKAYPAGFTNQALAAVGSSYTPASASLSALTNSAAVFAGGSLSGPFTNSVATSSKTGRGRSVENAASQLALSLTPETGIISGYATVPGTKQTIPFHGVLLQNANTAYGYFLEDNQSGSVVLGSE